MPVSSDWINPPKRWHMYRVDLEPRVGSKPGKQRPCLAIQPNAFAEEGLSSTVVLPLSSKITTPEAFPLRVHIPKGTCGLHQGSDVMIDQILAWDNTLFKEDLGELPAPLCKRVREALREFLELDEDDAIL